MKTAPLQSVKTRFGDKAKLVAAVTALTTDDLWLGRLNEDKGLAKVSNAKLVRLHDTLSAVKKDFGSRAKLIDAILQLQKRGKDTGLKTKLESYPTPRLVDLHASAAKRSKGAAAAAKKAKPAAAKTKKKLVRSRKAQAKAKAAPKK